MTNEVLWRLLKGGYEVLGNNVGACETKSGRGPADFPAEDLRGLRFETCVVIFAETDDDAEELRKAYPVGTRVDGQIYVRIESAASTITALFGPQPTNQ
jgi:hypothetical protein